MPTPVRPSPRRDLVSLRVAAAQESLDRCGVLSRDDLAALGVDDRMVRREVAAGRWRVHGTQTVALHTGRLEVEAERWRAVWEVGSQIAALDGVTSLQAAGLTGYDEDDIHVSVKHTAQVIRPAGVRLHKVIRRLEDELVPLGVPRTQPSVAAIRAAHWAVSDRQAALVLVMPVQQRLVTARQLLETTAVVRGRTRRAFIPRVLRDIANGAQSLGELDFAGMCRRRGLPEPSRQVLRHGRLGRVYLDVGWESARLAVEIDGAGHRAGLAVTADNLRQNQVVIGGERVLRIDLIGLRVAGEAFMDQVCTAYAQAPGRGNRRLSSGSGLPRTRGRVRGG